MSEKTCKKCGHTATYNGLEPQSCPACGAIYAKVEEALRAAADARANRNAAAAAAAAQNSRLPSAQAPGMQRDARGVVDVHAYAASMRDDSLYPFWRKLVGIVTILGYILAAILLIAAFITISKASVTAGLVGIVLALFVAVMARVGKEASLMLADLSDASVRLAAHRESKQRT